jgi:hypothetical protein
VVEELEAVGSGPLGFGLVRDVQVFDLRDRVPAFGVEVVVGAA